MTFQAAATATALPRLSTKDRKPIPAHCSATDLPEFSRRPPSRSRLRRGKPHRGPAAAASSARLTPRSLPPCPWPSPGACRLSPFRPSELVDARPPAQGDPADDVVVGHEAPVPAVRAVVAAIAEHEIVPGRDHQRRMRVMAAGDDGDIGFVEREVVHEHAAVLDPDGVTSGGDDPLDER